VSILDVDEATKNVHKEAVATPEFVRLAREEIPVGFGVTRDPPYRIVLKSEACVGVLWLVIIVRCFDLIGSWLGQFVDVLAENPLLDAPFSSLAGLQFCSVQIDCKVVTQREGGAQDPLQAT